MRLQKYMALAGVASRRKSEEIILNGDVKVNNKIITKLGTKVDPYKDRVMVYDKGIKLESQKIYIMLNKPMGYVSTVKDEKGRKKVIDLIDGIEERIYPVGRLDADTTGLLLLTNDGNLTYKVTHPSNNVVKIYIAIIEGVPNKAELTKLREGLFIDGRKTLKAKIKILKRFDEDSIVEVQITEGRNRQVKKMFEAINHPVKKLKRIAIGDIQMGNLDIGNFRFLNQDEIEYLKSLG